MAKTSTLLIGLAAGAVGIALIRQRETPVGDTVQQSLGEVLNDIAVPDLFTYPGATIGTTYADASETINRSVSRANEVATRALDYGAAALNFITPDFVSVRDNASFSPGGTGRYIDASNPVSNTVNKTFFDDGETLGGWLYERVNGAYDPNA